MNKLVTVLVAILVAFSIGLVLVYQRVDLENQKSGLKTQIAQLENQKSELETQIQELENQTSQLEEQIDELEKQIEDLEEQIFLKKLQQARKVEITEIESEYYTSNGVGVTVYHVYVNLQNFGTNDVDGLTVLLFIMENVSFSAENVGVIEAGSTKTVHVLGTSQSSTNVASLQLGDTIIDEVTFDVTNP